MVTQPVNLIPWGLGGGDQELKDSHCYIALGYLEEERRRKEQNLKFSNVFQKMQSFSKDHQFLVELQLTCHDSFPESIISVKSVWRPYNLDLAK